ncbi:MAG: tetratricopeptide repeat protein, partial [Campylobacterota bacterium]|nr:tetratricopeptide repeat protein [Campylobacterota bacterium]
MMNLIKYFILVILLLNFSHANAYEMGLIEEQEKSYAEAFNLYKEGQKNKDKRAIFKLATFYYTGKAVKKNYSKAFSLFKQSSKMGYEKATYNLGIFHSNKRTKYYSPKKAYTIFLKLANKGHAAAQNRLGMFYTFGFGVEVDYKK